MERSRQRENKQAVEGVRIQVCVGRERGRKEGVNENDGKTTEKNTLIKDAHR